MKVKIRVRESESEESTHALVVLQGLSSEIQHCFRNYSLTEKVTNLKICSKGELIIFILLNTKTRL